MTATLTNNQEFRWIAGTIKSIAPSGDFAFIQADGFWLSDILLHKSVWPDIARLSHGQRILCHARQTERGLRATLAVLEEMPPAKAPGGPQGQSVLQDVRCRITKVDPEQNWVFAHAPTCPGSLLVAYDVLAHSGIDYIGTEVGLICDVERSISGKFRASSARLCKPSPQLVTLRYYDAQKGVGFACPLGQSPQDKSRDVMFLERMPMRAKLTIDEMADGAPFFVWPESNPRSGGLITRAVSRACPIPPNFGSGSR